MIPSMSKELPEDFLREEVILPTQFVRPWTRPMTPERRLAFAVLWAAVFDLQKYRFANRRRHQRRYMEAYLWVTSDDLEWEFSFKRLCEAFEVNAEEARGMLLGLNGHAVAPASMTPSHAGAPHGGLPEAIEEAA